jgi:large subunit ribosomal protein L25
MARTWLVGFYIFGDSEMGENLSVMADVRRERGKGAIRRLRRTGMVPGIVYGGQGEPEMISIPHSELDRHLKNEVFYSSLLGLKVGGKTTRVVLKGLQRHPAKPLILHVDFQRVSRGLTLKMTVPIHFENQETSIGVKAGGKVSHQMTELEVLCLPEDLPEFISVDIGAMGIGETLHVADLRIPEGVEISHAVDPNSPVVTMHGGYADSAVGGDEGDDGSEGGTGEADPG